MHSSQLVHGGQLNSAALGATYPSSLSQCQPPENPKPYAVHVLDFSVYVFVSFPIQLHTTHPTPSLGPQRAGTVSFTLGVPARSSEGVLNSLDSRDSHPWRASLSRMLHPKPLLLWGNEDRPGHLLSSGSAVLPQGYKDLGPLEGVRKGRVDT